MEMRYPSHPAKVKKYTTKQLRREFLIKRLFVEDEIAGLQPHRPDHHRRRVPCQRQRGAGGRSERAARTSSCSGASWQNGTGTITADGTEYAMNRLTGCTSYGTRDVVFASGPGQPARLPEQHAGPPRLPTTHIPIDAAEPPTWAASPIQRAHDLQVHPSRWRKAASW